MENPIQCIFRVDYSIIHGGWVTHRGRSCSLRAIECRRSYRNNVWEIFMPALLTMENLADKVEDNDFLTNKTVM